jgi:uncharacterized membrane protein
MTTESWAAILGMALVTYLTRAGGLWLIGWLSPGVRLRRALAALPGALLVSLIAPAVAAGGPGEAAAALLAAWTASRTGSLPLAMATGTAAVIAWRSLA